MKIAVSGKGGTGKTTLSCLLGKVFAEDGRKVFLIDADPDSNLSSALGLPAAKVPRPLSSAKEIIAERTGTSRGSGFVKLAPRVGDIPERFAVDVAGMKLLILGQISKGGTGCTCPENSFLKAFLLHLLLQRDEVVIVDMEAGIEHLGRATVAGIDALLVVVEPGRRSIETALRTKHLARDIGLECIFAVGNKIKDEKQRKFIERNLSGIPLVGLLSYHPEIERADFEGKGVIAVCPAALKEARFIVKSLEERCCNSEKAETAARR